MDQEEEAEQARKEAKKKPQETITNDKAPHKAPGHLYRNARDAAYVPPSTKNIGAQEKPQQGNRGPAYKTLPLIYDPEIATSVYKRSMNAPITLTQRELLSLSPEIRSQVRDNIITKHVPNKDYTPPKTQNYYQDNTDQDEENDYYQSLEGFTIPHTNQLPPPEDAFIIPDPFKVYLNSLRPEENPDMDHLVVTRTSSSVHSINVLIDGKQKHKCILNPGSQVIAMSEVICHKVGLPYDQHLEFAWFQQTVLLTTLLNWRITFLFKSAQSLFIYKSTSFANHPTEYYLEDLSIL